MELTTSRSRQIQRAMAGELTRAMRKLKLDGHPRPYFISYLARMSEGLNVWGRYGTVFRSEPFRESDLYAEVRVGSHKLDQIIDGGLTAELSERDSYNWVEGPEDLKPDTFRYCFWRLTQLKYEEALQEFYDKRKLEVDQPTRRGASSFSSEEAVVINRPVERVTFPRKDWEQFVRDASGLFRNQRGMVDPYVRIRGMTRARVYVNSDGTKFVCQESYYELSLQAWVLADDGMYLTSTRTFYGRHPKELPTLRAVRAAIDEMAVELRELSKSRPMEPYAGPALLSGLASGLVFHEAIGHRLEGERMAARSEGQTFAAKIGERILPAGVDVIDDPSMAKWEGQSLYGHYVVDDEGVPARPVKLVEKGVLKTFLLSRTLPLGARHSNGHGRHERYQDPMARMANLIVTSRDNYSWDELKAMLLDEVRRRELPYGIILKGVSGGETRTDRYDFQAFKGVPTQVYTVDPRTGKETRVRNVNFIGTPLAAVQHIVAFGKDYEVDNSYCFAESGSVPVATISPSMLVRNMELQRTTERTYRPPVLPSPVK